MITLKLKVKCFTFLHLIQLKLKVKYFSRLETYFQSYLATILDSIAVSVFVLNLRRALSRLV